MDWSDPILDFIGSPGTEGVLDPNERIRTVWVFPPPVAPRTVASDRIPVWDGPQPVVGIDVRTMTINP